jgi:hypothetical protein
MNSSWTIYYRTVISTLPPHANISYSDAKKALKVNKIAIFARYTSSFDCGFETDWWYCICDKVVDLDSMKAKQRSEIKKGLKNCYTKLINVNETIEDLWETYLSACLKYDNNNQNLDKEKYVNQMLGLDYETNDLWGVFNRETDQLIGYAIITKKDYDNKKCASYMVLKYRPDFLSLGSSGCLIYDTTNYYLKDLDYSYVYNSERSIRHDTNIQNYMIKLFGYRKAYCRLNIIYKPHIKMIVSMIYLFRAIINRLPKNKLVLTLLALIVQEEAARSTKKAFKSLK